MAKRKVAPSLVPTPDQDVSDESIREFGKRNMTTYAIATNLDRSVPDIYDGCKPVHRRVMFGASHAEKRFVKTARIVGDVLGKYHPHGDQSVADSIATLVNMPCPPIHGSGNWGSLTDDPAAMRYTEMRLSLYGLSFFRPEYIHKEVTPFVPNYDDSEIEPVTLPAMLPNVLLNGGEGIGVGITTQIPTFTYDSIIGVVRRLLKGEKLEPADYAKALKFAHRYGGRMVKSKENEKGWLSMFETSKGRVQFESEIEVDRDNKSMKISDWPPGTNLEKFVEKIRAMPETQRCYNSKGSETFSIECKPAYNYAQFDKFVEKVRNATRQRRSFKLHVTKRVATTTDGVTKFETSFHALSVPKLLRVWLRMRIELELKSLAFRIRKQNAAIAYSKLMLFVTEGKNLDVIVHAVRKTEDPKKHIMTKLKLSEEQALQILALQLKQLGRLEERQLRDKLKEQEKTLKQLQQWESKPKQKVLLDLDDIEALIARDTNVIQAEEKETFVLG